MTETTDTAAAPKNKKGRSPSYPGVPLDFAIERAKVLYDREQLHEAPVSAIMGHWNYAAKSGPGTVTLAALKKYGLLEDEGSGPDRRAKLTPLAMEIILNPEPGAAIRKAALNPPIHQQMFDRYLKDGSDLPTDATLKYELHKLNFTTAGAADFISQFRKTIAFANLTGSGTVHSDDLDTEDDGDGGDGDTPEDQRRRRRKPKERNVSDLMEITIPLAGLGDVEMILPRSITEKAWDQMIRVLEVMKDGIVEDPADDD